MSFEPAQAPLDGPAAKRLSRRESPDFRGLFSFVFLPILVDAERFDFAARCAF
jgi:hypothetical protein